MSTPVTPSSQKSSTIHRTARHYACDCRAFDLPNSDYEASDAPTAVATLPSPYQHRRCRPPAVVLFVTRDRDLRELAARVLGARGYRVLAAAHAGHAVLASLKAERVDVR